MDTKTLEEKGGENHERFDPIEHLTQINDLTKKSADVVNGQAKFINNLEQLAKNTQ